MTKRKTTHVMYSHVANDWYVKDGGNERASKRGFKTQKEAITWARAHSIDISSELLIHTKEGNVIRQADSHEHDPRTIKG